jgi:tripartite-type tricarboxylate transporter receptor subunit TctC
MGVALGQNFPSKPVRIVTAAPGGSSDLMARVLAQGLSASLGQQAIVENRTSGVVLGEIISKAPADGYTLLVTGNSFWLLPLLQEAPYDPIRDTTALTLAVVTPNIVVVHPSLPVKSIKDLIALARSKPDALNYASGITGAITHLAAELFKNMANVRIVRIPYKGAGPAVIDLLGGQMQLMFATSSSVEAHTRTGRLRSLAVTSAAPSALLPGLPTVAASGLPGYEAVTMTGALAPARMSAALVNRLNREMVQILNRPEVRSRLFDAGNEVVASSADEFLAAVKAEMTRMGKVIKDAGIRSE